MQIRQKPRERLAGSCCQTAWFVMEPGLLAASNRLAPEIRKMKPYSRQPGSRRDTASRGTNEYNNQTLSLSPSDTQQTNKRSLRFVSLSSLRAACQTRGSTSPSPIPCPGGVRGRSHTRPGSLCCVRCECDD
jgi:hypothetical protein